MKKNLQKKKKNNKMKIIKFRNSIIEKKEKEIKEENEENVFKKLNE